MFEIDEDEGQMKTYDKDGTCIKCGYGGIEDVHQDAESQALCDAANALTRNLGDQPDPREPTPEHIARTCKNCGYSWEEKPLDATGESSFDKFVDAFMGHLSDATGETREEILKKFKSDDTDNPEWAIVDEPGITSEAIKEAIARTGGIHYGDQGWTRIFFHPDESTEDIRRRLRKEYPHKDKQPDTPTP